MGEEERQALRGCHPREVLRPTERAFVAGAADRRRIRQLKAQQADRLQLFPGWSSSWATSPGAASRAIVSSDAEANIRRTLGPETAALVAHYACGAGLFGKPPNLREVLNALRIRPEEALYVGDEAARRRCGPCRRHRLRRRAWGFATPDALRRLAPDRLFAEHRRHRARLRRLGRASAPRAPLTR